MPEHMLFHVVFLSQILLISFYYPRKILSRMRYVFETLRWPRLVGQLFKVYSDCHSYRQNLLGQIFLSLLLRL